MSAGSENAEKEWDKFYQWCLEHEDVPAIDAVLAGMTVLAELDRRNAPKYVRIACAKVYDWLMDEAERIKGSN